MKSYLLLSLLMLASSFDTTSALASIIISLPVGIFGRVARQQSLSRSLQKTAPDLPKEQEKKLLSYEGFDADAYRQEMTNLVYQRNIQRFAD